MMKTEKLVKGIALAAVDRRTGSRRNSCISHGF